MRSRLKSIVKDLLRRTNYRVVRCQPGRVRGIDWVDDARDLIRIDQPTCFDVGANCGQSIKVFQKAFKDPRIFSFEPATAMFEQLLLKDFGDRVSLHNFALGVENTSREFLNNQDSCLSSFLSLSQAEENRFRHLTVQRTEMVEVRTIDSFVGQEGLRNIDLLKVDTQGFDLQVLRGASDSLCKGMIQNVFVELNFVSMYDGQAEPIEIQSFLALHGLHLVDYYEKVREMNTLAWCTALFTKR